jgi:hypothetical protein
LNARRHIKEKNRNVLKVESGQRRSVADAWLRTPAIAGISFRGHKRLYADRLRHLSQSKVPAELETLVAGDTVLLNPCGSILVNRAKFGESSHVLSDAVINTA